MGMCDQVCSAQRCVRTPHRHTSLSRLVASSQSGNTGKRRRRQSLQSDVEICASVYKVEVPKDPAEPGAGRRRNQPSRADELSTSLSDTACRIAKAKAQPKATLSLARKVVHSSHFECYHDCPCGWNSDVGDRDGCRSRDSKSETTDKTSLGSSGCENKFCGDSDDFRTVLGGSPAPSFSRLTSAVSPT